jgi:hypothetical protein
LGILNQTKILIFFLLLASCAEEPKTLKGRSSASKISNKGTEEVFNGLSSNDILDALDDSSMKLVESDPVPLEEFEEQNGKLNLKTIEVDESSPLYKFSENGVVTIGEAQPPGEGSNSEGSEESLGLTGKKPKIPGSKKPGIPTIKTPAAPGVKAPGKPPAAPGVNAPGKPPAAPGAKGPGKSPAGKTQTASASPSSKTAKGKNKTDSSQVSSVRNKNKSNPSAGNTAKNKPNSKNMQNRKQNWSDSTVWYNSWGRPVSAGEALFWVAFGASIVGAVAIVAALSGGGKKSSELDEDYDRVAVPSDVDTKMEGWTRTTSSISLFVSSRIRKYIRRRMFANYSDFYFVGCQRVNEDFTCSFASLSGRTHDGHSAVTYTYSGEVYDFEALGCRGIKQNSGRCVIWVERAGGEDSQNVSDSFPESDGDENSEGVDLEENNSQDDEPPVTDDDYEGGYDDVDDDGW